MRIMIRAGFFALILGSVACEQPVDSVIQAVDDENSLLQGETWQLEQFTIEVKNTDIPPPILLNSSDSLITTGKYDLDDMVPDASDMRLYEVKFSGNGDIISNGVDIDLLTDSIGKYFVINDRDIRMKTGDSKLIYTYFHHEQDQTMSFTVSSEDASRLINRINDRLVNEVANETPSKIGDAVAEILFNNDALKIKINDALVAAISGKLSFLNEMDPDSAANQLAAQIFDVLQSVDWEGKLASLIETELNKLTDIDPETAAENISNEVVEFIYQEFSVDHIYDFVLPYMEYMATDPEGVSENLATLIVNLLGNVFDEEHLQPVIEAAWERFTRISEEQVNILADTLTGIVEDRWINANKITSLVLPFTQKIDETPVLQLNELAAQTTDSLEVLVNKVNDTFPQLDLSPDYEAIETAIQAIYVAAKPVIGVVGGPEEAAMDVANLILENFLTSEFISNAFSEVITGFQHLDPETVGNTVATWLVNLSSEVAPEVIMYLTELFSPILENLDPEYTAFKIAQGLNEFIVNNLSASAIKERILPYIEAITGMNTNLVAHILAKKILDLDVIKENVTEENLAAILLPVLQNVSQANVEQLAQNLINAIVNSQVFKTVFTEERISTIISILIYKSAWENVQIANNFKEATIILNYE